MQALLTYGHTVTGETQGQRSLQAITSQPGRAQLSLSLLPYAMAKGESITFSLARA